MTFGAGGAFLRLFTPSAPPKVTPENAQPHKMQTLKLLNPFKIGGESVKQLTYDPINFTGDDYLTATGTADSGPKLTFALAAQLIIASNRGKGWTPEDFKSLKGVDVVRFVKVGTDFFEAALAEPAEETTGEPPASSQSDSTLPSRS